MLSKTSIKKKDSVKNSNSYKYDIDNEVKVELEAMSGLEYNLHGEVANEISDTIPLLGRKTKMQGMKESNKINDKVIFETEKLSSKDKNDGESSIPYLSSSVSKKELRNVIEQAGHTSEDRYKILEARDRLMRLRQRKIHTLDTAKATVGTCPDMCPEKERLMREFQRQVASYELLDSSDYKINNETAVKQYSRSSADQEEPMPQDLRPVSSLKMTMSYLLHEIVDLCEEESTNLAEWYHFLWDRTRGIRKDITQQELCCIDTVKLVEECARFHIVCSERLCAEELSVFDKKINTENLTKCLQTLKYMYNDLRVKGVACQNESEFRAYIILLNLNNANFMWDLQRLPSSIQKSPEVNFAVRIYSAIQSNNYARFFTLVKNTTYLNACILLRYFFQVRIQALNIMVKAYCRTTSTAYPLYEFIDILAFTDENEAIYFCERAGLNISEDEMYIILNRQNIISPSPSTSEQGRSKNIVAAKRIALGYTIGQVIAGGIMPEQYYINHKAHNSFDSRGYLKTEAINASDQSGNNGDVIEIDEEPEEQDPYEYMDEDIQDEVSPPPSYVPTEGQRKKSSSLMVPAVDKNKDKNSEVISSIFSTSIFSKQQNSSKNFQTVKFPFASTLDTSKNTEFITTKDGNSEKLSKINEENSTMVKSIVNEKPTLLGDVTSKSNNIFTRPKTSVATSKNIFTFTSNLNTATEPKTNIFSRPIETEISSTPIQTDQFNSGDKVDVDNISMSKIATTPITIPKKKLATDQTEKKKENEIRKKIDKSASKAAKEIETEVIRDECSTTLKQEFQNNAERDQLCTKIFNDILINVTEEYCQSILETEIMTQKKIHDLSNRIKNRIIRKYCLIWRQRVSMKKQQREALDNTPVWLPKYSLAECAKNLYNKDQDLVIQNMRCKNKKSNDNDENDGRSYLVPIEIIIHNGLKKNAKGLDAELSSIMFWKMIISWPNLNERFLLARYKKIMCEYFCSHDLTMDPIIKIYKPNPYETLNICIRHMNDVIGKNQFTGADGLFFIVISDEKPKLAANRLTKTIKSKQKLMRIPLVVVIFGDKIHHIKAKLTKEIQKLIDSGYLSKYIVYCETKIDESIILRLTQTAIDWLTRHKSSTPPLEMNFLSELINSCLIDELWLRISGHASFNTNLAVALNNPKFVIDLHNEAISHLIDIINDPESLMYTNFPSEFKGFLPKKFTLPCTYEYFDKNWKTTEKRKKIERIIRSFILPPWQFNWPINDTIEFHKCITRYCESTLINLNYSRMSCNILNNLLYIPDEEQTPNFVHIILGISKERLNVIDAKICVVYNKNHIKHFQTFPWWFKSDTFINFHTNNEILKLQQSQNEEDEEPAEKKRRIGRENEAITHIINQYSHYSDDDDPENNSLMEKSNFDDVLNISQLFEKTLSKQLLENSDFEKKLDLALRSVDIN